MSFEYNDSKAPLWESLMIVLGIGSGVVSILILFIWICFYWLPTRSKDHTRMTDTSSDKESTNLGPEAPRSSSTPRASSFDVGASFDIMGADSNKPSSRGATEGDDDRQREAFPWQQHIARLESFEEPSARSCHDELEPPQHLLHRTTAQQRREEKSAAAMAAAWRQQAHALSIREEYALQGDQDNDDDGHSASTSVGCPQPPLLCGFGQCV